MTGAATALADWAIGLEPDGEDRALARRSLLDTIAVALAAREDPVAALLAPLPEVGRWAALAHVLDYDDLHLPSTTHISAVCVPVALASGGGERAYLAGAGAMARLGTALGWRHYEAGWHATSTAGAPAAAVAAAVAFGLDRERTAVAIGLSVAAAGGVQRAFGTSGKSLQVAHAAEMGLRSAELARAGASADPGALDDWIRMVGGDPEALAGDGPAVPGGLAVKLFPCCYALQRPIGAVRGLGPIDAGRVRRITARTPESSLAPLIHHDPTTGLEAKFSLEYGIAAAILDGWPGIESFGDPAVERAPARVLMSLVEVKARGGGDGLLSGEFEVEVELDGGEHLRASLAVPAGAPERPPTEQELDAKLAACAPGAAAEVRALDWQSAAELLRARL